MFCFVSPSLYMCVSVSRFLIKTQVVLGWPHFALNPSVQMFSPDKITFWGPSDSTSARKPGVRVGDNYTHWHHVPRTATEWQKVSFSLPESVVFKLQSSRDLIKIQILIQSPRWGLSLSPTNCINAISTQATVKGASTSFVADVLFNEIVILEKIQWIAFQKENNNLAHINFLLL